MYLFCLALLQCSTAPYSESRVDLQMASNIPICDVHPLYVATRRRCSPRAHSGRGHPPARDSGSSQITPPHRECGSMQTLAECAPGVAVFGRGRALPLARRGGHGAKMVGLPARATGTARGPVVSCFFSFLAVCPPWLQQTTAHANNTPPPSRARVVVAGPTRQTRRSNSERCARGRAGSTSVGGEGAQRGGWRGG